MLKCKDLISTFNPLPPLYLVTILLYFCRNAKIQRFKLVDFLPNMFGQTLMQDISPFSVQFTMTDGHVKAVTMGEGELDWNWVWENEMCEYPSIL